MVDESAHLPNILRKARILAHEIGLPEFQEWVDFELSGYSDKDKVPSYRRFSATSLGTFSGPFGSGVKNMVIPTMDLPDPVRDFASNSIFLDGVGALEGMLAQEAESYSARWPYEFVALCQEVLRMDGGAVLVDAHKPTPRYLVSGILDNIKNKLLDFILGLQKSDITPERLGNGSVEPGAVRNLFNVHIYGDHNVVASGENVHQELSPVSKGDIGSLLDHLRELSVANDDLRELKDAVSSEPHTSNGELGPKVRAWVGGMISKASSDVWKIGLEAAPKVLMDALNAYYGTQP